MAGAGAAGGAFAGGLLGRLNTQNPVARVAVGGVAGAVVSGGMTALRLGRWDEAVIHAAVVGGISGAVDAAADYWGDTRVQAGVDVDQQSRRVDASDVRRALDTLGDPYATRGQKFWAQNVLLDARVPGIWRGGESVEQMRDIHTRYADGLPVYERGQPPRFPDQTPDPEATGPHSRLRWDTVNNRIYQAREFDAQGRPVRDIDFTSPTDPSGRIYSGHPGPPHQHRWVSVDPNNPRAGYRRLRPEPFDPNCPGRVVDIDEAAELSGIPREYLEDARRVTQRKGVDAASRDVNPRLGEVAPYTVPKPTDVSSPMWKTNEWGYVQNQWTGKVVVERPSGRLIELSPSKVYDPTTGEIILDPSQGRVVGPDIDQYWVHGPEGPVVGETPLDIELRGYFSEAMGRRITHGQWMEYLQATGPNGPALVITRQGEFVWLQESEIPAWYDYVGVPYPFPR